MRSRGRRRRSQGGWATVETLALMPVLILSMAASLYAWSIYDGRIDAMKRVRGPVFTAAINGCGTGGTTSFEPRDDDSLPLEPSSVPIDKVEGADLEVVARKLPSAPGNETLTRPFGGRTGAFIRTVTANGLVGGFTAKLQAKTTMTCNEHVEDGQAQAMKNLSTNSFDPRNP